MMRNLIVSIFFVLLSFNAYAANWNNSTSTEKLNTPNPINALAGLGINSMALWSGGSRTDPNNGEQFLDHFLPLETYGIKHVVLVSCADWLIDKKCKKQFQDMYGIIKSAKLLLDNTKLHVVVQLKAYEQKKVQGKNTSNLQSLLEKDDKIVVKFTEAWAEIAKALQNYPAERLSFNLLNEPEFELPKITNKKRDRWLAIAEKTSIAIRKVSPERPIIVEGVGKSLHSNRNGRGQYKYTNPSQILIPIGVPNIIYAFHSYEPEQFLQQAKYRYGSFGKPYKEKYTKMIQKDAQHAIKWSNRHKVPIMLTETGCIGFLAGQEGPKTNEDCGKFAADIKQFYLDAGIGVSWWALEKEKTIYNRDCPKNCWMPSKLEPNKAIFDGFGLTF